MTSRAERDLALMLASFQNLGPALKRMKQEQMAKELLGEDLDTYKLRTAVEDNDLDRQLKKARIERELRPPRDPNAYKVMTPYGPVSPHEAYTMDKDRRSEEGNQFSKLDKEIESATGFDLGTWRRAKNKRIDPETGEFVADVVVTSKGAPVMSYDDATGGERPVVQEARVPRNVYESFLSKVQKIEGSGEPNAAAYVEPVKPKVADAPAAKKDYPIGTKARKGDQWFVMTEGGWKPAVP